LPFAVCRVGVEVREGRHHVLVERQQPLVDRDADQGRGYTLGDRLDVVCPVSEVGVEVRVQNENAVSRDLHAVDGEVLLADLLDHFG